MSYFKGLLTEDEKPIHRSRLHWVYLAKGFWWFISLSLVGYLFDLFFLKEYMLDYSQDIYIMGYEFVMSISMFKWFCIGGGLFIFLVYFSKYISTEILLTNERILYKTGLIAVKAQELELQEIKEERVNHGLFGYFLNYGEIHLDCSFVEDFNIPVVSQPVKLMKAIYKARARIHSSGKNPDPK